MFPLYSWFRPKHRPPLPLHRVQRKLRTKNKHVRTEKKNNGKKRENREKGKKKTTDEEKNVTPIKRQMSEKMIVTKYEKKTTDKDSCCRFSINNRYMSSALKYGGKQTNLEYNILNTYDTCISCFCFGSNKECY